MFEKHRIERLKESISVQRTVVDCLAVADREYGNSYYTNRYIDGKRELERLRARLKTLQDRIAN